MAKTRRKNRAAVLLGRKGGRARWKGVPAEERSRLCRKAVLVRWRKAKEDRQQG